ncbi:hypothetical protein [uncultured Algoriphagus sp.]|uniref:hypothetical protein n=1 Tax=uncultured Algoriphagus sp. TaxID=417365 RepID=UPI0030EEA25A
MHSGLYEYDYAVKYEDCAKPQFLPLLEAHVFKLERKCHEWEEVAIVGIMLKVSEEFVRDPIC